MKNNTKSSGLAAFMALLCLIFLLGCTKADMFKEGVPSITDVTIDKTSLSIEVGQEIVLVATVSPSTAKDKSVIWQSSNKDKATVDPNGKVRGVAAGLSIITAIANGGKKAAAIRVTINPATTNPIAVKGVVITSAGPAVINTDYKLTAMVIPATADQTVTWTVVDKGTTGATIAAGANVLRATAEGTVKVKATSVVNPTIFAERDIRVNATAPVVASVTITSARPAVINTDYSLTAAVEPSEADQAVTWTVADKGTTGATIAAGANVLRATAEGTVKVKATSVADPTIFAEKNISVLAGKVSTDGITLNKTSTTIRVGATETLTATVTPDDATDVVNWSSDRVDIAKVDPTTGVVTAIKAGNATITATAGSQTASCTVIVEESKGGVPVEGISLSKTSITMLVDTTEALEATVTPNNAANKSVKWTSDKKWLATVDEKTGLVTAKAASNLNVIITATTADGSKTATCEVTVEEKAVAANSISLNKTSITMLVDATETLTATVLPLNTTEGVKWSTSDATIATVSRTGVVTAIGGGSATITATAGSQTASCTVTVNVAVEGVTVSPATASLTFVHGTAVTQQLTATISPGDATNKRVRWSSFDESIAMVDTAGLVTAVATGTTRIIATTVDGGFRASAVITINPSATPPATFEAAGLENGNIPDSAFSASSYWGTTPPKNGRLNASADNCWAPLTETSGQWWQVDLGATKWVGRFASQGRGVGEARQWIMSYKLKYSLNGSTWTDYNGGETLTGNTDQVTVVTNTLTAFKARYIRVYPITWDRWPSGRFEVYVSN